MRSFYKEEWVALARVEKVLILSQVVLAIMAGCATWFFGGDLLNIFLAMVVMALFVNTILRAGVAMQG